MKILIIFNRNFYYVEGAPSNRFRSIFEGLAMRNNEVHVMITGGYYSWDEYFFHKKFKYPKNLIFHYVGTPYQMRSLKKIEWHSFRKRMIINKQKKLQAKNRFVYGWINYGLKIEVYQKSINLLKKSKAKIVQEISEHPKLFHSKEEYDGYIKFILPKMDIIFLMTKNLLEFYKQNTSNITKLFHIPMTVDMNRFNIPKSEISKGKFIFSYVGLMNNKKDGVDVLIKAFSILCRKHENIILRLIGPKKPEKDFQEQISIIKDNNLENKVEYLGVKSREEIPMLLTDSDCLVLARPNSKQAQFGFPTKLGEYLASGNPVVVTSVGEIPYYLEDNVTAYISKPDSIDDFANKLQEVLNDKKKAIEIGKEGFKIANKYFNTEIQLNSINKILIDNFSH